MYVSQLLQQKLSELGLEQRELANAAEVTESYISQLLSGKKMPPAPDRTDIYQKLEKFLKLQRGRLAALAELQRKQELKKKIQSPPGPLFGQVREVLIDKCRREKRRAVSAIFAKEPFGELERLVTQKLLDVVKALTRQELDRESWLRLVARLNDQSYKQIRVTALDFLDSDVFNISPASCSSFLDPLIVSWDIDLASFALEIVLNRKIAVEHLKRFEFVEKPVQASPEEEPGLRDFLKDRSLRGTATREELEFLKQIRFVNQSRPTALYYYRELQSLRDPLHFRGKL